MCWFHYTLNQYLCQLFILNYTSPQTLTLAERMERAVYLSLDSKKITAKYVAGRKIL